MTSHIGLQRFFLLFAIVLVSACRQNVQPATSSTPPVLSSIDATEQLQFSSTPSLQTQQLFKTETPTLALEIGTVPPTSEAPLTSYFNDLIELEWEKHRGEIAQAGASPIFISVKSPDALDSFMDLDTGVCCAQSISDLKFSITMSEGLFIEFVNGALYQTIEAEEASLMECSQRVDLFSGQIIFPADEVDTYVCVLTNEQRISLLHIDSVRLDPMNDATVRISFVTWDKKLLEIDCAQSLKTQLEMNVCAGRRAVSNKETLWMLIEELNGHMGAEQYATLLSIQSEWEEFAVKHCEWEANFFEGGSIRPKLLIYCLNNQYRQRINELRINLCQGNGMSGECEEALKYKE